jgi:ribulose-5-phosphate 4-epimerase/fuculose-1-phosphate aldolase
MSESALRDRLVLLGASLFDRGYSPGSSGNLSVRLPDGFLVTPTNSCLGRLDSARLSKLDPEGRLLSGDPPSKEAVLHRAVYRARPADGAVVHLHSTASVAVSCLEDADPEDLLPPLTPYAVMRVGRVPLVPYHPPGDPALADAVAAAMRGARAVLLANHGPVVSGPDLDAAVHAAEEVEEAARLVLALQGRPARRLSPAQCAALRERAR